MVSARAWRLGVSGLVAVAGCGSSSGGLVETASSTEATSATEPGATAGSSSTPMDSAAVVGDCAAHIEDPVVAETLWEDLGLPRGSVIPSADLATVDILNLWSRSVASLAGLECAAGLRIFQLESDGSGGNSPHTVDDLSPISQLPALGTLSLSYPELDDISALADLPSLSHLNLARTQVSDIAPLAALPNLYTLAIAGTPVTDLGPLADFPRLGYLHARDAMIADISPLVDCEFLKHLDLDGTAVTNISALASMPSLRRLNVDRTAVTDLSAFSESNLSMLDASQTQIAAIPENLSISQGSFAANGITDLSPLLTWPRVASLNLSDNAIEDVSPLLSLPWDTVADECIHITLNGNPLSHPDVDTTLQTLCDSWHVVVEADDRGCSHADCGVIGE